MSVRNQAESPRRGHIRISSLGLSNPALQASLAILIVSITVALYARQSLGVKGPGPSGHDQLPASVDVFVTVYTFDRPVLLLKLLQDIAANALNTSLVIGVHIIDDNSEGCAPNVAPLSNFFDVSESFSELDEAFPLSLVSGRPHPETRSLAQSQLSCVGHGRLRQVADFVRARSDGTKGAGVTFSSPGPWRLFTSHYRHGRRRHWHLVRMALRLLQHEASHTRYFVFLPDDVRLATRFFDRATAAWDSLPHSKSMTLMLHIEDSRMNSTGWTDFAPVRESDDLVRIGWVESGNFIAGRQLLSFLNWSFPRVPIQRWVDNPPISSGVGSTLSELLHSANFHMYRTEKSHLAHIGVSLSKMNAEFRTKRAWAHVTSDFIDGEETYQKMLRESEAVSASIASTWNREASLHAVVDSLAAQVDHIYVYLNGYDAVPTFLRVPYITALLSSESGEGDIGDVGKFFWANQLNTAFHMTADDDIVYPDDYVSRMLDFWAMYEAPVAVGVHGINIVAERLMPSTGRRGRGYYGSREVFMGVEHVPVAQNVHILGTGTLVYRVEDVGMIDIQTVFPKPNMADIWFGIYAQNKKISLVTVPHAERWLREIPGTFDDSIYNSATKKRRRGDRDQTAAVIAASPWTHCPPREKSPATGDR